VVNSEAVVELITGESVEEKKSQKHIIRPHPLKNV